VHEAGPILTSLKASFNNQHYFQRVYYTAIICIAIQYHKLSKNNGQWCYNVIGKNNGLPAHETSNQSGPGTYMECMKIGY